MILILQQEGCGFAAQLQDACLPPWAAALPPQWFSLVRAPKAPPSKAGGLAGYVGLQWWRSLTGAVPCWPPSDCQMYDSSALWFIDVARDEFDFLLNCDFDMQKILIKHFKLVFPFLILWINRMILINSKSLSANSLMKILALSMTDWMVNACCCS